MQEICISTDIEAIPSISSGGWLMPVPPGRSWATTSSTRSLLRDPAQPCEYLRLHHSRRYGDRNYFQHKTFLDEVGGTPLHKANIDWFLTRLVDKDKIGLRFHQLKF